MIGIPMIVFGSQVLLRVLGRFPILVMLGGGLIGWIAGDILVSDPAIASPAVRRAAPGIDCEALLAVLVVAVGMALARWGKDRGRIGRPRAAGSVTSAGLRILVRPTAPRRREGPLSTCSTWRRGAAARVHVLNVQPTLRGSRRSSPRERASPGRRDEGDGGVVAVTRGGWTQGPRTRRRGGLGRSCWLSRSS